MIKAFEYDELQELAFELDVDILAIVQDYATSVFLYLLSKNNLTENLIFKGGTAIKKAYFPDARFSVDLDFDTIKQYKNTKDLDNEITAKIIETFNGIHGSLEVYEIEPLTTENWYFANIKYRFFDVDAFSRIDIDINITPNKYNKVLLGSDLYVEEKFKVNVYPIETILQQKFLALPDRTNSKDLWDIFFLVCIKNLDTKKKLGEIYEDNKVKITKERLVFIINEIISEREYNVIKDIYIPSDYKTEFKDVAKCVSEYVEENW